MSVVTRILRNEPAAIIGAVVGVLALFGVQISDADASSFAAVLALVLPVVGGVVTRQFVTPATARGDDDHEDDG